MINPYISPTRVKLFPISLNNLLTIMLLKKILPRNIIFKLKTTSFKKIYPDSSLQCMPRNHRHKKQIVLKNKQNFLAVPPCELSMRRARENAGSESGGTCALICHNRETIGNVSERSEMPAFLNTSLCCLNETQLLASGIMTASTAGKYFMPTDRLPGPTTSKFGLVWSGPILHQIVYTLNWA